MLQTGIVRQIDKLGRIVIPSEIRRYGGLDIGTNVEIYVKADEIILRKYKFEGCQVCGETEVIKLEAVKLCKTCLNAMLEKSNEV